MVYLKNKTPTRSSKAHTCGRSHSSKFSWEYTQQQSLQSPHHHSHPDLGDPSSLSTGTGVALRGQSCSCSLYLCM